MSTIKELEESLKSANRELDEQQKVTSNLTRKRNAIILDILEKRFGVKPGVVVQWNDKRVKVEWVESRWGSTDKPWVHGHIQKKDGTWGVQERLIFDEWETIKDEQAHAENA